MTDTQEVINKLINMDYIVVIQHERGQVIVQLYKGSSNGVMETYRGAPTEIEALYKIHNYVMLSKDDGIPVDNVFDKHKESDQTELERLTSKFTEGAILKGEEFKKHFVKKMDEVSLFSGTADEWKEKGSEAGKRLLGAIDKVEPEKVIDAATIWGEKTLSKANSFLSKIKDVK